MLDYFRWGNKFAYRWIYFYLSVQVRMSSHVIVWWSANQFDKDITIVKNCRNLIWNYTLLLSAEVFASFHKFPFFTDEDSLRYVPISVIH